VAHYYDDIAAFLDAIEAFVRRYVIFQSDAQSVAVALWTVHTHAIEAADTTPYLGLNSPEKRCGKTTLQEVLEHLVARPLRTSNASTAAVFTAMQDCPTLLFDEVDALFNRKGDGTEEMRGLINAGHRRGSTVLRVVAEGKTRRLDKFDSFGPKCLAVKGARLPDTIEDRSILIRLQRKRPGERVSKFRYRTVEAEGRELHDVLEQWGKTHIEELENAIPNIPDALGDRAADGWEPLLAIADIAGKDWPARARAAALELAGAVSDDSTGVLLLSHLREMFDGLDRLPTETILRSLIERDDGPWADWWEKRLAKDETRGPATKLSKILRSFDITHKKLRFGERTAQGYLVADFQAVFERYLPPPPPEGPKDGTNGTVQVDGLKNVPTSPSVPSKDGTDSKVGTESDPVTRDVPTVPTSPPSGEGVGEDDTTGWTYDSELEPCDACGVVTPTRDQQGRVVHPACKGDAS
jgi:Protein of unknown function (DUF3631)